MSTWEVALANGPNTRVVLWTEVPDVDLGEAFLEAVSAIAEGKYFGPRVPAILITRSDQTPEALAERRDEQTYDRDRRGYRRRRYRKTPIEKEWEEYFTRTKREVREAGMKRNRGVAECKDCGAKWTIEGANNYSLVHVCGKGLVKQGER